ncbi:MAG: hypothetical protein PHE17_19845 [Thiothrix sp.]|uniref:hypothetical protein n=1 Tax=Thiothrix sp. TaxID=1032 RepID=UPI0026389C30|nr:hypothetical protein [Thiothrix sp.]MDD5395282.1 hypothetical protein [Thiothrix sp.]
MRIEINVYLPNPIESQDTYDDVLFAERDDNAARLPDAQPYDTKDFRIGDIVTVDNEDTPIFNGLTGVVSGVRQASELLFGVDFPKRPGWTVDGTYYFWGKELFLRHRPNPHDNVITGSTFG